MDQPSRFVMDAVSALAANTPPGRALDVAMGSGRHAIPLAALGYRVFGVDRDQQRLRAALHAARARGLTLRVWAADLTGATLPESRFDLIVCTRFLDRALFPVLARALAGGGVLVYETFTTGQLALGRGPRSLDHLLKPGELAAGFPTLTRLHYEEVTEPEAVARIIAARAR